MRLPILFVRKGVEDAERRRRELEGEPDRRRRVPICQFKAGGKEVRRRLLLALASSRTNNPHVIIISSPLDRPPKRTEPYEGIRS
jgi:hypothetical protein